MISNTSPLILLARIGKLSLLKSLYGKVKITNEVKGELLIEGKTGIEAIRNLINEGTIIIKDPKKVRELGLDNGETSVIILAIELNEPLIMDDAQAIKVAKSLNIETFRTTTLIFSATKKKLITKTEALAIINSLIDEGYYIAPKYYKDIIDRLM